MADRHKGLVHLYTGTGKGKTTAALGLAMRALGNGWKVCMVQFMKGGEYGEIESFKQLENFKIQKLGTTGFVDRKKPSARDIEEAKKGLVAAREAIGSDKYDLVILDEIVCALDFGLLELPPIVDLIKNKPDRVELVLTGRGAPQALVDLCDYVTEMREAKHPYQRGVAARKGIEY
jgi:cob(I)alamin adenosyltransferase